MPDTPTEALRKLRERIALMQPAHAQPIEVAGPHHQHKYNLRSKSRTRPKVCKTCGSSSVVKRGLCRNEQRKSTPRKPVVPRRKKPESSTPCVICLDTEKAKRTKKVKCGHEFHVKCINSWLKCSDSCPVCRFQLRRPCLNLVRRLTLRVSPFLQFHFY